MTMTTSTHLRDRTPVNLSLLQKVRFLFINLFFQGLVFAGLDMFEALGENEFSVHVLTSLQKCEMAVEALLAQTTNVANLTAVTLAQPKIANGFTGTS